MFTTQALPQWTSLCGHGLLQGNIMKLFYALMILLANLPAAGQIVKGKISSDKGTPVSYATVTLDSAGISTRSDDNGDFTLHAPAGNYILTASRIGFTATQYKLTVHNGKNEILDLVLNETAQQLKEVKIGDRHSLARDRASFMAAKLPLTNLENPQVVHTVNNQVITEEGATDLNTILRNLPGIVKGWASTTAYYSSRGFNTRNYIRNGVAGYVTADADIANIEQVVAVKGPSGTLFGSSLVSFGGVLNRITKKPFATPHTEISYQAGSYDLNRMTLDINTPLSEDRMVLLRINSAYQSEGSFQDAGFSRGPFVAASLFYQLNDRLTLALDGEYTSREATSQPQISPAGPKQAGSSKNWANNPDELPLAYTRSYANNSVALKSVNKSIYGELKYKLTDQWKSQTILNHTIAEISGNYLTFNLLRGDSTLARNVSNYPGGTTTITLVQQNFNGDIKLAGLRNRIIAGLEYFRNSGISSSNALNGRNGRQSFDTLNIKYAMPNYSLISPSEIQRKLNSLSPTYSLSELRTFAAYASDVINVTEALSLMLSLRVDRFENKGVTNLTSGVTDGAYNQTSVAPKLGLTYQLIKDRLMVFGNYNNGFQNVAPVTQPDGTVSVFKPQYANQIETGFKTELAKNILNATISYYRINVSNTLRPDVSKVNYTVQDGRQISEGIELDLSSQPLTGLLINGGFTYNNSRLTAAQSAVNGLRPVNSGPAQTVNFYGSYRLIATRLQGLGIGFGGNYNGRTLIINNTTAGQFFLNSYLLLNAGLFYDRPKFRLGFNMDNLGNKQYYNGGFGSITPGMLRRSTLSLTVKI